MLSSLAHAQEEVIELIGVVYGRLHLHLGMKNLRADIADSRIEIPVVMSTEAPHKATVPYHWNLILVDNTRL